MRAERWWTVIFTMGLFMALGALSAQAGPNRPFAPQPNRQAFTPPQPRAQTTGWNSQPRQWQQPRGNAYGQNDHRGQWQHHPGNAYGWNGQNRQWQQPRGNAYGQNDHRRQWQHHPGNAYGWNGQNRQWQQPRGNAYGQNDHQRQWQQPRPSVAQGDRSGNRQFQPPNGGQQNNPASAYNRAGYPAQSQSPNISPSSSGYYHNSTIPAGQTGARPGFHRPEASGTAPQPQGQSPSGAI